MANFVTSSSESPFCESKTRTFIVHRDHLGYGLTLSGDQPVHVQTVRSQGAADRAGVQEADIIVKVNGHLVTEYSHSEVVKLIQEGEYVALTVARKLEELPFDSNFTILKDSISTSMDSLSSVPNSTKITAPKPPNSTSHPRFGNKNPYTSLGTPSHLETYKDNLDFKFPQENLVTWTHLPNDAITSKGIINMDDDDFSDAETAAVTSLWNEEDSPFKCLQDLFCHQAYLAVFLNYIISNSNPACLFFYLITESYKQGSLKEMQKWAFEIHSSFIVPKAPLRVEQIEETNVEEIDRALEEEFEKEDVLRKLFWKVRVRCREELKDQLSDFCDKRDAGLGGIFGPSDSELKQSKENRQKELQIIDDLMIPLLDSLLEDIDNATDTSLTIAASLSTILSKTFKVRSPDAIALIDKCPSFVSKEKKPKFFGRTKKTLQVKGHQFELKQYHQLTYCNHSQSKIWGIGPQGYQCTNCGFNVHKKYVQLVEETCIAVQSATKKKNRSGVLSRILSDRDLTAPVTGNVKTESRDVSVETSESSIRLENSYMEIGESSKKDGISQIKKDQQGKKIGRAHSCKLEKEKNPKMRTGNRERRKHSDPNIPRQNSDTDIESSQIISNQQSASSSTSSLSARSSLESPGGSLLDNKPLPSPPLPLLPTTQSMISGEIIFDSDFETEPDPPDWRLSINQDELSKLKAKETKRQDVINELFHTEKSHVRNLKVLDRLFYRPMLENSYIPRELIERLFPNLDEVIKVHTRYNLLMKERIKQGFPIGDISDILTAMFDGESGDQLIEVASEFTKNQKQSIEDLNKRRLRDHKLEQFLLEQERRPECRRLGLQSILPVEHLRLVKYPLLLEQLAKQSDENPSLVEQCVERTKNILDSINKRVAEAQNVQRLAEIQKNLDTSGLEKNSDSPIYTEYKNLDLTKHHLIYDGALTLKLGDTRRFKTIDLHVILLEDCIMLLQKQDDKYLLKFHTSAAVSGQGDNRKFFHSPVIKFSTMLVRPVATDKRAFYLLNTTQNGPQIYELVASSSADRSQWFRHITEASNAYKAKENRRSVPASFDRTKKPLDSLEKKESPPTRSHSFHEPSTREPQSQQLFRPTADEAAERSKQTDSTTPTRKRLQRVEIMKISEPSPLIDPSQVVVTQGEILVADPVLTPLEKIRRKDLEVKKLLEEKQGLIADILQIPVGDFDDKVDVASQPPSSTNEAREVLLAALSQAKNLADLVNENLNLGEEDVALMSLELNIRRRIMLPVEKLIKISSNINNHLTSLLTILQERDEERDHLRREIQRYKEQADIFLLQSRPSAVSVEENLFLEKFQESEEDV